MHSFQTDLTLKLIFHFNFTDSQTKTFHSRITAAAPLLSNIIIKLINRAWYISTQVSQTYFWRNSVKINVIIIIRVIQV